MDLVPILIGSLSALTIAYFFVGLIGTYFIGSTKVSRYGLAALVIFTAIIFIIISRSASYEGEHLASAIVLALLFFTVPIASLTFGIITCNIGRKILKK